MIFWTTFLILFALIILGALVLRVFGEPQPEDWRAIQRRARRRYRWLRRICISRLT